MKFIRYTLLLIIISVTQSCIFTTKHKVVENNSFVASAKTIEVEYAKGFTIKKSGDYHFIEINDLEEESSRTFKYALVANGTSTDSIPEEYTIIRTPVTRVICMTTLQLSPLLKLDAADRVVGLTSTRYIHNEQIKSRIESGEIRRIGIEGEFDTEVVMASKPEVIFTSPFKRGGYDGISDLGITTFNYLAYKESSPLGQAEWIKLVGVMLGLEEQAHDIFQSVEEEYLELQKRCQGIETKPKVMSGELHSGSWYVVGGESYLAHLIRDAGAEYFMENDRKSGGFYVDFETVYAQGHDAAYWRIVNSHNGDFSYSTLLSSDSRYKDFKSFRDKGVIYCNLRERPFYEKTPMEPNVVLADMIKIFHPELIPEHQAVYYQLLR